MNKDITIVSVCVDFDDYLSLVIKSWLNLNCHEIIIVTADDDIKTKDLCNEYSLKIISIPREKWIRGRYLNAGMREVKTKWTLILDSDCWIPKLDIKDLDDNNFYGLPFVPMTPEELKNFKLNKIKAKNVRHRTTGAGFFQLFNTDVQRQNNRWYTEKFNVNVKGIGASIAFKRKWKKRSRNQVKRLSEDYVICISNGPNRFGRKTNRIPKYINAKSIYEKLVKFKKFTNSEIGIAVYKK